MHELLLCSYYSDALWKHMLELPTAHYFLSVKGWICPLSCPLCNLTVWAAHAWSDIIKRLKVSGQLLPTELPMCSPWADIILSQHKKWAAPVHVATHCFSGQPICSTWQRQPTFHFCMGSQKGWCNTSKPTQLQFQSIFNMDNFDALKNHHKGMI